MDENDLCEKSFNILKEIFKGNSAWKITMAEYLIDKNNSEPGSINYYLISEFDGEGEDN